VGFLQRLLRFDRKVVSLHSSQLVSKISQG